MLKQDVLLQMIEDQAKLDKICWKNAGVKEIPLSKIRVALLVECGELANEVNSWKYWKRGKFTDKEKAKQELADCIHFTLTLMKYKNMFYTDKLEYSTSNLAGKIEDCEGKYKDEKQRFLRGMEVSTLFDALFYLITAERYHLALLKLFEIGFTLELNFDQIVKAYYIKRNINLNRQKGGY